MADRVLLAALGVALLWALLLLIQSRLRARRQSSPAHQAHARLQSIINSAVDGIITIDARGRIESFNHAAERLFGYTEREVIGRNVRMLMPEPYAGEHDGYLSRYVQTGEARIIGLGRDVRGLRRDGTTFPLHLSVGEMRLDGERFFTGILHDRTSRVKLEETLREQASLARLGEMAAVVAHEVKNPLAGIKGAIQVIAAGMAGESAERPVMDEIVRRIDTLNELMKDLLLFARPPAPRHDDVRLAELVAATASLMREDPALRAVRVHVDGAAPVVRADAELLKIVFQNLLINGAHAMNGRGEIQVSLDSGDGRARVAVHDEGPGIPPEIREKIFTPFFTTKTRGTGLGLPTARRLIEAQQGRISIECPPAGGTTVIVELPAAAAAT